MAALRPHLNRRQGSPTPGNSERSCLWAGFLPHRPLSQSSTTAVTPKGSWMLLTSSTAICSVAARSHTVPSTAVTSNPTACPYTVPQRIQIIDGVGAGGHPCHDRIDLRGRVHAQPVGDGHMLARQDAQPAALGQSHERFQPGVGDEVPLVEDRMSLRQGVINMSDFHQRLQRWKS